MRSKNLNIRGILHCKQNNTYLLKKTVLFFLVAIIACHFSYGQTSIDRDSLLINTKINEGNKIHSNETKKNEHSNISIESPENEKAESQNKLNSDSIIKRLNLYTPQFYVGPGDKPGRIPTTNIFENEYTYHKYYPISNHSYFSTTSSLQIYPGMGAVSNISGAYTHELTDWLSMSLGTYISKQEYYLNSYHDIGTNANFKFYLNDRFRINIFGQHSFFGKDNGLGSNARGLYPQSLYGTSLEYKINDKFGVQGGFIRELNPMTGKWENQPFIAPVFYKK